MDDHVDIGSSPPGESCAQVGLPDYEFHARKECRAYISLLRRTLGPEPDGARLGVRSNPHDFGPYLSVVCYFVAGNDPALDYAFRCESDGPEEWDDVARQELGLSPDRRNHDRLD
jgi:hypothetical protein